MLKDRIGFRAPKPFVRADFAVVAVLAVLADLAAAEPVPRFFFSGDGHLTMSHGHFDERLELRYRHADGSYDEAALARIAHFFRSREDGAEGEIALRTIELIDFVEDRFRPQAMVLISGYRSPEFNEELRGRGARAAQSSLHTEGLAADIAFRGLDLKKLWVELRELKLGGVGYYRKDGFLHLDSGRPRFWEPQTSKVEKGLARGNAKIFARTDFDRYAGLGGATIRLHSVTALPLRLAREAVLEGHALRLEAASAGLREEDGCLVISEPAAAYRLRVAAGQALPAPARGAIRLRTCEPRVEATPEQFETNSIELLAAPPAVVTDEGKDAR